MGACDNPSDKLGELVVDRGVKWEINESLLQSYRGVFIASQSLFVGAVQFVEDSEPMHSTIIAIAIFQLFVGCNVIDARAKVVDFYKYNLSKTDLYDKDLEEDKTVKSTELKKEKVYVNKYCVRVQVNEKAGIQTWRWTRIKFDVLIPLSFMVIWVLSLWPCLLQDPLLCIMLILLFGEWHLYRMLLF